MPNQGSVSQRSRPISVGSSEESKFLSLILRAVNNQSSILAKTLGTGAYDTSVLTDIGPSGSITFAANTIHTISIQVITGTADVSTDNGATTVTYPSGSNINMSASSTFDDAIIITASAGGSDRTLVNTIE